MGNRVIEFNKTPERIRDLIESAGTTIGSVHFIKRSDGSLRKMCYRLHVKKPSVAAVPKGLADNADPSIASVQALQDRKAQDLANNQITVLDANKVVRDEAGKKIGRGAWRTVPLDSVVQVTAKGTTYVIQQ